MVNEPLRASPRASHRGPGHAKEGSGAQRPSSLEPDMANPKPLMAKSSGTDPADAAVQSALRTLDAEGGGIAAITAALQSDLGAPLPPPPT